MMQSVSLEEETIGQTCNDVECTIVHKKCNSCMCHCKCDSQGTEADWRQKDHAAVTRSTHKSAKDQLSQAGLGSLEVQFEKSGETEIIDTTTTAAAAKSTGAVPKQRDPKESDNIAPGTPKPASISQLQEALASLSSEDLNRLWYSKQVDTDLINMATPAVKSLDDTTAPPNQFINFSQNRLRNYWDRMRSSTESMASVCQELITERQNFQVDDEHEYMKTVYKVWVHLEEHTTILEQIMETAHSKGFKAILEDVKEPLTVLFQAKQVIQEIKEGQDQWSRAARKDELSNKEIAKAEAMLKSLQVSAENLTVKHTLASTIKKKKKKEQEEMEAMKRNKAARMFPPHQRSIDLSDDEENPDGSYQAKHGNKKDNAGKSAPRANGNVNVNQIGGTFTGAGGPPPKSAQNARTANRGDPDPDDDPSSDSSESEADNGDRRRGPPKNPKSPKKPNHNLLPTMDEDPIKFGAKGYMKPEKLTAEANPKEYGIWKGKFQGWFLNGQGPNCSLSQQLTILSSCLNTEMTGEIQARFDEAEAPVYASMPNEDCLMDALDEFFMNQFPLHARRAHLIEMENPDGMLDSAFAKKFIQACEDAKIFEASMMNMLTTLLATKIKNKSRRAKI